ncbi:sigma-70 family RNA polymerase sigma factor [Streptomyces sp. NPDC087422]|uniref:sigma-70 family RNA polymerase sigma factor n=1 Tax=Streptomyces sp. NPDC087422 TaxID=3365786 RepID=UPI0037FF0160
MPDAGPTRLPSPPEAECWESDGLEQHMLAAGRGDQEAFTALYTLLFPMVKSLVQRRVRLRAEAEDIAQDVMAEVWAKASLYRPEQGSVRGWVVTIAHRRAVDWIRRNAVLLRSEDLAARRTRLPAGDNVLDIVERRMRQAAVRRGVSVLTDLQREAIHLAFYAERSHQEVAETLGIPLGTAKSRVRSALTRLRRDLGLDLDLNLNLNLDLNLDLDRK